MGGKMEWNAALPGGNISHSEDFGCAILSAEVLKFFEISPRLDLLV